MMHLYPEADKIQVMKTIQASSTIPEQFWTPQEKQKDLLEACGLMGALKGEAVNKAICQMIGYGGAAFGGKTEGAVAVAFIAALAIPGVRIGYFRRMFTELEGADGPVDRSRQLYPLAGGSYNNQKHVWTFENGSEIHFCHCKNAGDRFNYQSQAFDILIIDEATHFTWKIVDYLITRNRPSKTNEMAGSGNFRPFSLFLTNPGNIGHMWYLKLFDPQEEKGKNLKLKQTLNMNGMEDISYFIPAFVKDNPRGLEKDPEYIDNLMRREPALADALLRGDWSHYAGQILGDFNWNLHTCDDFQIPPAWSRWRSIDWGVADPWCVLHWTKNPDTKEGYLYNMTYRRGINDPSQALIIRDELTLPGESFIYSFADPSMWTKRSIDEVARSTADVYASNGIYLTPADNNQRNKIAKSLSSLAPMPNGLYPFRWFRGSCKVGIELLPTIVYDENDVNKIADGQEDHVWDTYCYGLTNWVPPTYVNQRKKDNKAKGKLANVEGL